MNDCVRSRTALVERLGNVHHSPPTPPPRLSMDLASDSEKGEQWDTVSVTLPVNNPAMPLVLSFPANDSRPLQSRQEIALFYGMERSRDKRERGGWVGGGARRREGGDEAKKGPSGNMV